MNNSIQNDVHIIMVDDEMDFLTILEIEFERDVKEGRFKLHCFERAQNCLDFVEEHDGLNIALIVTDINMPEMDGLELLGKIKSKYPDIDVLICSAYHRDDYIKTAAKLGAKGFLEKPIRFEQLRAAVTESI